MNKTLKEILLIAVAFSPLAFFGINYDALPDAIPTHFNYEGVADDFTSKDNFIWMILALSPGLYLLMLILPFLDPKKRLTQMGDKYFRLRLIIGLFGAVLMCYIIYTALPGKSFSPNLLLACIAALFAMFGNYFQTIRPNYFVGIRTPWTLENDDVWTKTHRSAGRIWMACGTLLLILAFLLSKELYTAIFSFSILIMVGIPIVHSYMLHRKMATKKPDA